MLSIVPRTEQLNSRPVAITARSAVAKYFYLFMSLLIVAVVVRGFSFTIGANLIHRDVPPPWILYVHATIFFSWLVFFALQSSMVRLQRVVWHLRLGWFGVVLGTLIPIVGVSTTVLMGDLEGLHAPALVSQFVDLLCFTGAFWLAVFWRKQPELHKRLIFVATCVLTGAAFARFPERTQPIPLAYAGVDFLILLGVARDLIVDRRVHRVYLFALPLVIVGQVLEAYFS